MPQKELSLLRRGQTILFDGDSITSRRMSPCLDDWPFLRLSNWHQTYAHRVSEWLFCNRPDLALKFHHAAVGGSSCRHLLERFVKFVQPVKPHWVILTIGPNDQAQKIPLPEFKAKMSEYCSRIRQIRGGRVLALGGIRGCPGLAAASRNYYAPRRPYYAALKSVMAKEGGIYLDIGRDLQKKAQELYKLSPFHTVYSDGVHYNALGNEIIAMLVLRKLGVIQY